MLHTYYNIQYRYNYTILYIYIYKITIYIVHAYIHYLQVSSTNIDYILICLLNIFH